MRAPYPKTAARTLSDGIRRSSGRILRGHRDSFDAADNEKVGVRPGFEIE
jgi:hypothetical protein